MRLTKYAGACLALALTLTPVLSACGPDNDTASDSTPTSEVTVSDREPASSETPATDPADSDASRDSETPDSGQTEQDPTETASAPSSDPSESAEPSTSEREPMAYEPITDYPAPVGLTGWDIYRDLNRVTEMQPGVQTRQFSSFDREGGNWKDGFDGTYSYLDRQHGLGFVIAEDHGPGEIQSLWFTRDGGNVRNTGKIYFELDGEIVLEANLQDLVSGKVGAPFVFPFVANAKESSGGVTIKVPMPYRESMRVITEMNPLFYHLSYRSFSEADGITTFDPEDVPEDVMEASKTWGQQDPKPAPTGDVEQLTEAPFELAPDASHTIATLDGSGQVGEIILKLPHLTGAPPANVVTDDGRAMKGSSAFTVAIDPSNEGIVLTRRYDSVSTNQRARILVDGDEAAMWTGQGIKPGGWIEEKVEIPAEYTKGKDKVRIENQFISAGMDFSEFRYFVDSLVGGEVIRTDEVDIGPFVAGLESEAAHDYEITGQQWEGDRVYVLPDDREDDPEILKSDAILENLHLRIEADGEVRVDAPVGEFFGTGLGQYDVHALFYRVDAETGTYTSWWPMPFAEQMTVSLVNHSEHVVEAIEAEVSVAYDPSYGDALTAEVPRIGYFHTAHEKGRTVPGKDWIFLDVEGQGRFMGVNHTMDALGRDGNTRGYLEGDERFYVDGIRTPFWHGTGTEDLYEGGWYFNQGPFSNPMNGAPATEASGMFGTAVQSDSAYRLLVGDAIDFHTAMVAGIEPGGFSEFVADYSSTAFWYGHPGQPTGTVTDQFDVADDEAREARQYEGDLEGIDKSVTLSFEGNYDDIGISKAVASSTAPIRFDVAIDPANIGVRLIRMGDQKQGYQTVDVRIDGEDAGTWQIPNRNVHHSWHESAFDLPRALTEGKERLTVELLPHEEQAAWTAAQYRVLSIGRPTAQEDTGTDAETED